MEEDDDFRIIITDDELEEEIHHKKRKIKIEPTKNPKKQKLTKQEIEKGEKGELMPETKLHQFSYKPINKIKWIGSYKDQGNEKHYQKVQINGITFQINEFAYLFPPAALEGDPFWVIQIKTLFKRNNQNFVTGVWFFRDTDIYPDDYKKSNMDPYQLYISESDSIDENMLTSVCGKAFVHFLKDKIEFEPYHQLDHFYCLKTYNPLTKAFSNLPQEYFLKDDPIPFKKTFDGEIRALDLFSGCGGFSNGMEMNKNIKVSFAVDLFRAAMATYKRNHPHTKVGNSMILL
jgi:hypothetical protein